MGKNLPNFTQLLTALYVAGCFVALSFVAVYAIATGYSTDETSIQPGMAVSLSDSSNTENPKVIRSTNEGDSRPIGVTVSPDENLVTTGDQNRQIYVQTTGEADAFVSDLNGAPKKGDLLSSSPLKGILVVADATTKNIVGIALEDFSQDSSVSQTVDKSGTSVDIRIDKIRISLDQKGQNNSTEDDSSLERLGQSVTGKSVGEVRVVIALVIFLIVLIAECGIIYGAISSAITALGRNPMARKTIIKEMIRVIIVAIIVLLIGLAGIYGILWV